MTKIKKPEQLSDRTKEKMVRGGQGLTDDEMIQVLLCGWKDRPPMTYEEIADVLVWNSSYSEGRALADRFAAKLGMTKKDFLDRRRGYKR